MMKTNKHQSEMTTEVGHQDRQKKRYGSYILLCIIYLMPIIYSFYVHNSDGWTGEGYDAWRLYWDREMMYIHFQLLMCYILSSKVKGFIARGACYGLLLNLTFDLFGAWFDLLNVDFYPITNVGFTVLLWSRLSAIILSIIFSWLYCQMKASQ